jgi:paraquat-inducible protein B
MARQREGDVSTFHFTDNLNRAIRHTGRVLIDLIPHVYSGERIVRVMGEDGTPQNKQLNKPYPATDEKTGEQIVDEAGQVVMAMHDLSAGKYDLTVTTGPSFTTRREEAAFQMTEMMRALPASAPILGKHLAKNLDWPGADEIAEELEAMSAGPQIPPELQQQIEEGQQKLAEQEQTINALKTDQAVNMAKVEASKQEAAAKLQADEQIELAKIASAEKIAMIRIASDARISSQRAEMSARQVGAN